MEFSLKADHSGLLQDVQQAAIQFVSLKILVFDVAAARVDQAE
jgi:hypothetical protein